MSGAQPDLSADRDRRHGAAVRRSLRWADEAAERADWANAIGWIEAVEACGDELPDEFRAKRDVWLIAMHDQRSGRAPGEAARA